MAADGGRVAGAVDGYGVSAIVRGPRSPAEQLRLFARARAGGATLAEVVTLHPVNILALERALGGYWFMVDHAGLAAGLPKTVFAACSRQMLEDAIARQAGPSGP